MALPLLTISGWSRLTTLTMAFGESSVCGAVKSEDSQGDRGVSNLAVIVEGSRLWASDHRRKVCDHSVDCGVNRATGCRRRALVLLGVLSWLCSLTLVCGRHDCRRRTSWRDRSDNCFGV